MSQKHASVPQGRNCSASCTCCHTAREVGRSKFLSRLVHSILTPGQPVPALTLQRQAPGRVSTRVPFYKSLAWPWHGKRSTAKAGVEPRPAALEVDALPPGQQGCHTLTHTPTCPPPLATGVFLWRYDHLVGLVVKASASRVEDPGFESCLRWDFSRSSYTSDLKTGTLVATLSGVIGSVLGLVCPVSVYCDWVSH